MNRNLIVLLAAAGILLVGGSFLRAGGSKGKLLEAAAGYKLNVAASDLRYFCQNNCGAI